MGLDSYLYAKKFVASASWESEEECKTVKEIANLMGGNDFLYHDSDDLQFAEVKLQLAYWRKANQIHKFFVDVCGGGTDECQDIYVDRDNLKDLLEKCESILEDHSKAEELLPSQSGFFFGSNEYDEYYFGDLERTVPILKKILENAPENWEFEYHASW
jgi:hypothetical protein